MRQVVRADAEEVGCGSDLGRALDGFDGLDHRADLDARSAVELSHQPADGLDLLGVLDHRQE